MLVNLFNLLLICESSRGQFLVMANEGDAFQSSFSQLELNDKENSNSEERGVADSQKSNYL